MRYKTEKTELIAAAFVKAQSMFKAVEKNGFNPFHKTAYADLSSCISAAREGLAANGLAVAQFPGHDEKGHYLDYYLIHESGQQWGDRFCFDISKGGLQDLGSAITYARRYSFCALTGIAPGDDDDANGHTPEATAATAEPPAANRGADRPTRSSKSAKITTPPPAAQAANVVPATWREVVWKNPVGKTPMGDLYMGKTLGWIHENDPEGFAYWVTTFAKEDPDTDEGSNDALIVKGLAAAQKELGIQPAPTAQTPAAAAPAPESNESDRDIAIRQIHEILKEIARDEIWLIGVLQKHKKVPVEVTSLEVASTEALLLTAKSKEGLKAIVKAEPANA